MTWRSLRDEAAMAARLLLGLRPFLAEPLAASRCRDLVAASLAHREVRFLELLRRGVYGHPASPYLPLLRQAGVEYADVERMVRSRGIETALGELYDAGVRVTLDEFKGRRPIVRGGLEVATSGRPFDNPLSTAHFEQRSSGSRGPAARLGVDLDLLAHEACYDRLFMDDFDLTRRPKVLWLVVLPGGAGLKFVLRLARLGLTVDKWFSQAPVSLRRDPKHALLVRSLFFTARRLGWTLPWPEHVRLEDAVVVARWLARCRGRGTPAFLTTTSSCAVRVCAAASEHGLDIRDTFIRAGGEALSPGKMRVIRAAGCLAQAHYGMSEVGRMAVACRDPVAPDDVHPMDDKVSMLQRDAGAGRVPALWLTTLHWSVPRIMLNVELGDYGVLERRRCGCVWDDLGFSRHLHTIRSYEKLTTEGMHFMGTDLMALVEDILPARFGGSATDYQFVEEEQEGLAHVHLAVSPRVGAVDEAALVRLVLDTLGARDTAHRMMTALWRDGGTLRVVRREPYATPTGKLQTLHVARPNRVAS